MISDSLRYPIFSGLLCSLVTFVVLVAIVSFQIHPSYGEGHDFIQDYLSARAWLSGGDAYADLNRLRQSHGFPRYEAVPHNPHPPVAVLLATPFVALPFPSALLLYQMVNLMALSLSWTWTSAVVDRYNPGSAVFGGVLIGLWPPVCQGIDWGQPVGLLALTTVLVWQCIRSSHPFLSGAVVGAAALMRPFFIFLMAAWARRAWWEGAWALAGAGVAVGLGFVIVAISPFEWFRRASQVSEFVQAAGSIPGILGLGLTGSIASFAVGFALACLLSRWLPRDASIMTSLSLALLFYPISWFHYDASLIPAFMWTMIIGGRTKSVIVRGGAYTFWLLRMIPTIHDGPWIQLWLHVLAKVVLLSSDVIAGRIIKNRSDAT